MATETDPIRHGDGVRDGEQPQLAGQRRRQAPRGRRQFAVLATNYKWKVKVTLPAASVSATGTVEVWLIESLLDTTTSAEWSDALEPRGTSGHRRQPQGAKIARRRPRQRQQPGRDDPGRVDRAAARRLPEVLDAGRCQQVRCRPGRQRPRRDVHRPEIHGRLVVGDMDSVPRHPSIRRRGQPHHGHRCHGADPHGVAAAGEHPRLGGNAVHRAGQYRRHDQLSRSGRTYRRRLPPLLERGRERTALNRKRYGDGGRTRASPWPTSPAGRRGTVYIDGEQVGGGTLGAALYADRRPPSTSAPTATATGRTAHWCSWKYYSKVLSAGADPAGDARRDPAGTGRADRLPRRGQARDDGRPLHQERLGRRHRLAVGGRAVRPPFYTPRTRARLIVPLAPGGHTLNPFKCGYVPLPV
jgi:hypothetical protein